MKLHEITDTPLAYELVKVLLGKGEHINLYVHPAGHMKPNLLGRIVDIERRENKEGRRYIEMNVKTNTTFPYSYPEANFEEYADIEMIRGKKALVMRAPENRKINEMEADETLLYHSMLSLLQAGKPLFVHMPDRIAGFLRERVRAVKMGMGSTNRPVIQAQYVSGRHTFAYPIEADFADDYWTISHVKVADRNEKIYIVHRVTADPTAGRDGV